MMPNKCQLLFAMSAFGHYCPPTISSAYKPSSSITKIYISSSLFSIPFFVSFLFRQNCWLPKYRPLIKSRFWPAFASSKIPFCIFIPILFFFSFSKWSRILLSSSFPAAHSFFYTFVSVRHQKQQRGSKKCYGATGNLLPKFISPTHSPQQPCPIIVSVGMGEGGAGPGAKEWTLSILARRSFSTASTDQHNLVLVLISLQSSPSPFRSFFILTTRRS